MSAHSEERRREMDREIATVMANHHTILMNQDYISTQLQHQHDCIEKMKTALTRNTEVTEEVRDLLAALKVLGRTAKWMAVTGAALISIWQAVMAWVRLK